MTIPAIEPPIEKITEFCHKWQVTEFALFGSVPRDDFRLDSDVDAIWRYHRHEPLGL
ncbi:nucleotidyltransferase domain-containing protein [Romeria aff. gracilis LEGE 07310]|uniref:Nucleotidyltransferase domain-containing protein n=1 Tax=Vasconcelosia minhoensis LEGE 07310 TaxID=915328 RepID=A0A8J7DPG7_9CYAN|nr:nucleotidyltransferase domain-containing protein [Romeria gracilis]MBE9079670.1 nucleotidyltransferase domain-containing protein [Romeria aff. gracilis LEGE 07310]